MTNPILFSPASLSAEDRAAEITAILARAILRTHSDERPASCVAENEFRLGFLPDQRDSYNPF